MAQPTTNITLLDGLDNSFKEEFSKNAKLVELKKGEPSFMGDDLEKHFYIVLNGMIKSYQISFHNDKEQTLFFYRSGDMFDTITLLDGKPHDVMYEVYQQTTLVQLPISLVREWLVTNRSFNQKFFPYLAHQMRDMEELATDLSLNDTMQRLIKLLLQNMDKSNPTKYNLIPSLTNKEVASLVGSVRQVIERHLKEFREDGLIDGDKKHLEIKNIEALLEKL